MSMIVTFSVANFLSFNEEETFSMVASKRLSHSHTSHDNHLVPIPGSEEMALRGGILYGANGAGKSNFFKALAYLQKIACSPRKKGAGTGRTAFRFGADPEAPSLLDLQFIAGNTLYRYGLTLNDDRILEEWLLSIDGNREKVIYERNTDEKDTVTVNTKGLKGASKKLRALATVGGPGEQSFLATIRATLNRNEAQGSLREVMDWFEDGIRCIRPDSHFLMLGHALSVNQDFRDFAGTFLRAASTGVDNLHVAREELSEEQLQTMLPLPLFEQVIQDTNEEKFSLLEIGGNREIVVEKTGSHRYHLLSIKSIHRHETSREIFFDFTNESDGTQRLFHLLPALHQLHTQGGVFVIDEVERSMHPLLAKKFLQFFFEKCDGDRRQLIVTSHESTLLDQELLRRDEIWFAEKNKNGATSLYSLADFQPRKDLKLAKNYLKGRFGAIPFLGDIDQITNHKEEIDS